MLCSRSHDSASSREMCIGSFHIIRTRAIDGTRTRGRRDHNPLEGGYTATFERYTADADLTGFFAGLPDDRCQPPRWGYVITGRVSFKFAGARRDL